LDDDIRTLKRAGMAKTGADQVVETLAAAMACPGPVLIDAVVNRMELAMPPKVTAEMAKGFTLYMLKAVLNGRADEVIELARSSLRR
jgi:pyruvate dehydrogenase (quinone)